MGGRQHVGLQPGGYGVAVIGTIYCDVHPTATYSDHNATQHWKWWLNAGARQTVLEIRQQAARIF